MNSLQDYKQSGVDWVGSIPTSWNMLRGRFLFESKKEINRDLQCQNLLSLTLFGVLNKDYEATDGLRPENYNSYQIFQKDDLVFKMIDLENIKTSRVGIVHEEGIMSPVYIRHEPIKNKIDPRFAYWFYYDLYKKEIYNSIGSGVRSSLTSSDLLELELPVPPLEEQNRISRYLDKKTNQIDSLIRKIEKRVELLKEQRTSLINQFVTKGLDSNVKMKESNVEWIGKLPEHWNYLRLKFVLKGREERSETGSEELLSVTIDPGVLKRRDFLGNDDEHISRAEDLSGYKIVKKDDLVNNIMKMGFSCLGVSPYDGIVSPAYSVFKIDKDLVLPSYLHFLLRTPTYIAEYSKRSKGIQVSRMRLYDDFFVDISIPIPPLEEQKSIVKEINTNRSIQRIVFEAKRLELIKEYRQSLISSVVTGKLRVTEDML